MNLTFLQINSAAFENPHAQNPLVFHSNHMNKPNQPVNCTIFNILRPKLLPIVCVISITLNPMLNGWLSSCPLANHSKYALDFSFALRFLFLFAKDFSASLSFFASLIFSSASILHSHTTQPTDRTPSHQNSPSLLVLSRSFFSNLTKYLRLQRSPALFNFSPTLIRISLSLNALALTLFVSSGRSTFFL